MISAHDKIAAGLKEAITMSTIDPAVADAMGEALAEAIDDDTWQCFQAGSDVQAGLRDAAVNEVSLDVYRECLEDAGKMIRHLRRRGFDIVKLETSHA